jgi:hypothetical protein
MPRKKKETEAVEKHYLYELMAMPTEALKEHLIAVSDALYYHEQKVSDINSYKYRIDQIMKVKNWLRIEDETLNG